jgi:ubiquinone/menaquinone biosynthesis C-methylase UbiE
LSCNSSRLDAGISMKKDLDIRHLSDCGSYFDERSESWTSYYAPGGAMVGRLTRIVKQLKERVPIGSRILDFGCGTGNIAVQCGKEGYKVDAVDQSTRMVERARSSLRIKGVDFNFCANPLQLQFADGAFDAIIASSVLEYVVPLQAQLEELHRVCKDGGVSFITVPDMGHPIRWFEAVERCLVSPILDRLRGTWREREEYLALSVNRQSIRGWRECFARAGWTVIATEQRFRPLALIVAEKRTTVAANGAISV